ncbi:MAG: hypothetical protein E7H83_07970 [Enterobacteriaceae bacterium]|nr:hypothetical protein [Enterobacteriaceae bacterium]
MKSKNPNEVDLTLGGNNCHSYTIELDNVKNEQVVILSAGCFCDFVDEKNYPFSNEVFDWITSIKNLINKYASKYDVPPIAIAGCLANEYNTRFSKEYTLLKSLFDGMQDSIIPIDGCDPVECLLPKDPNTEQNIAVFELLSGRKIEKKENTVNRKLEEEYQVLKKTDPNNELRRSNKQRLFYAVAGDYGKGNISLRTAYDMYDKYNGEFDKKMSRLDILRYIVTDEGAVKFTTIYLYDAKMKLAQYVHGHPPRRYEAVLVTYFKQGHSYINSYLENIRKSGENRPIRPGEGCGICKQRERFAEILGVQIKKLILQG